ncbi:pathogenesis-related transcription factor, partial [Thalassiosira pseudonana CCMP1335]
REYSIAYRGVHFNKSVSKYQTKLHHSNKQHSIGCYSLAADAALAFDKAATVLKGLGRRINFVSVQDAEEMDKINAKVKEVVSKATLDFSSGYKGASLIIGSTKYRSYVYFAKKQYSLGTYYLASDAAWAHDNATIQSGGVDYITNF